MTKRKDGKALFEVITGQRKAGRPLGVPGWFGQAGPAAPRPPAPAAPQAGPLGASQAPAPAGVAAMPRPAPMPPTGEAMVSVSGGRVRVSLNMVSATVAVVALGLLLVGAFLVGRRSAPSAEGDRFNVPERHDVIDLDRDRPGVVPVPRNADGHLGPRPVGMVPDDFQREKGASYLIIQGGIYNPAEAEDIKRFLYAKNIQATIEKGQTGRYMVKDTRPFKDINSRQTRADLNEYIAKLEQYGNEYSRQGGKYDFRQNRTRPWLIQEK